MGILVYKYGLLPPTENNERVRAQMFAAHRYRNTLVEIERERRTALRATYSAQADIGPLEQSAKATDAAVDAAVATISKARASTQTRSETPEMRAAVKLAREARKSARAALREARHAQKQDPVLLAARAVVDEKAAQRRRDARSATETYWGTYLLVEASDEQARKVPLYDGAEPSDPRFMRWQHEGRVGVQIQGGVQAAEVIGGHDTRLRIDSVDERAWLSEVRGERRRASRTTLWMRVGSEGRDPIWAKWPMIMHRAFPDGARIKAAVVSLHKIGPRERWTVQFTIETIDAAVATCGSGAVAIDVGWRAMADGLRVGVWHGEDGRSGEILMDPQISSGLEKSSELRSVRDKRFDLARDTLSAWLMTATVPEWLREATKTLPQWKSPARLAALAKRWRDARFDGDVDAYASLEAWRYKDHHLWEWESSQRSKSLGRRRNDYRVVSAVLAKQYRVLVLEDFDLRRVANFAPTEQAKADNETSRSNRQAAAISELRASLVNAFKSRGGTVEEVSAVDTTRTCAECGLVEKFDAAAYIHHACSGCGVVWDQDANAAKVILGRWRERGGDDGNGGGARNGESGGDIAEIAESRWVRAKRMKAEKVAAAVTAREAGGKAAE